MPIRVVALLLLALALVALAAGLLWRTGDRARARVEALFRRPQKPPRPLQPHHYYRPYWS